MDRPAPEDLVIETPRLLLRMPGPEEAPALLAFQRRNREPHARFNAPYAPGFFQLETWRERLEVAREDYRADRSLCLVLYDRAAPAGPVVGTLNFTKVVRGRFQACYAGYTLTHERQGEGLMTEALEAGVQFVFRVLKLHRVMANYVPENERSGRLLERVGFVKEGYAKAYLYVAGGWTDHVLTARTNPDPAPPAGY